MISHTAPRSRLLPTHRVRLAIAAIFLGTLGLSLVILHRIAHAQPATDPLTTAQASVDGGVSLLITYGPVLGGMYLVYSAANAMLARYATSHWLAQGKRLAIATSVLGIAGAALQAQVAGSPWTVIVAAAGAAAFKLLPATVAGAAT